MIGVCPAPIHNIFQVDNMPCATITINDTGSIQVEDEPITEQVEGIIKYLLFIGAAFMLFTIIKK